MPMPANDDMPRLDRTVIEVTDLASITSDRDYWRRRPVAERFAAIELQRRIAYGYDPNTARLQGLPEVVSFPPA